MSLTGHPSFDGRDVNFTSRPMDSTASTLRFCPHPDALH
jgi:hypothetical protein